LSLIREVIFFGLHVGEECDGPVRAFFEIPENDDVSLALHFDEDPVRAGVGLHQPVETQVLVHVERLAVKACIGRDSGLCR
jgi:hypothetical protein